MSPTTTSPRRATPPTRHRCGGADSLSPRGLDRRTVGHGAGEAGGDGDVELSDVLAEVGQRDRLTGRYDDRVAGPEFVAVRGDLDGATENHEHLVAVDGVRRIAADTGLDRQLPRAQTGRPTARRGQSGELDPGQPEPRRLGGANDPHRL